MGEICKKCGERMTNITGVGDICTPQCEMNLPQTDLQKLCAVLEEMGIEYIYDSEQRVVYANNRVNAFSFLFDKDGKIVK